MPRPTLRAEALLLRRIPFSESSLVVHALTAEHGRVALLARGAYRPGSRYFALLDLLDTLELEWSAAREPALGELRRGELAVRRQALARDLGAYRAALSMLELADLTARSGQEERALHRRLTRGLDRLARGDVAPDLAWVVFELGFLGDHGLGPALDACAACGGPAPAPRRGEARAAFSAGAGGRLCPPCAGEARTAGRRVGTLPIDVLARAARLVEDEAAGREPAALPAGQLERVRDLVGRFASYHLETCPRSQRRFLATPDRNARVTSERPKLR